MTAWAGDARDGEYSLEEEFSASFSNSNLNLILLPTEQCNFRCTYCYEDFAIGRMKPDVVNAIKRFIEARVGSLRHLSLSWFGGEPLLSRDIIADISESALRAVTEHAALDYRGDITTNGSLLNAEAFAHLVALGIRSYQVSLDGPQAVHDETRRRATGKGSFSEIWANLIAIRDTASDVSILLRIHLTPENLPVMPDFLALIRDTFLADPRFRVLLKPIEKMGGPNNDRIAVLPRDARDRIMARLETILTGGTQAERIFDGESICYAARANSLVIRADGRIGKCTVALSSAANTIGRILPDGSLKIDNAILRAWLRGWESGDRTFLACPYASMLESQPATTPLAS
jgi:uncharacterized protein